MCLVGSTTICPGSITIGIVPLLREARSPTLLVDIGHYRGIVCCNYELVARQTLGQVLEI